MIHTKKLHGRKQFSSPSTVHPIEAMFLPGLQRDSRSTPDHVQTAVLLMDTYVLKYANLYWILPLHLKFISLQTGSCSLCCVCCGVDYSHVALFAIVSTVNSDRETGFWFWSVNSWIQLWVVIMLALLLKSMINVPFFNIILYGNSFTLHGKYLVDL